MAGKSCRSCAVRGCDQPHGTTAANTEFLAFFKDTKHPSDDSDRTSVPAHRQGPANRPVVQQHPTQQTEPQWLLITNPAVINDRSMNSLQPQPHGALLDTTVLSCRESTPRCATSLESARAQGPPPFGKRAARPILARAWPAYSLDDPKTLTCRGRCWWSCRSSMRSASPARARTGAQACSRSATATPADSPLIGTECLSTTLQHTCDQQTLPPGVRALLSAGSARPTSRCTRACRRAPPGDLTQGLDLTAFFLSPQSIVVC